MLSSGVCYTDYSLLWLVGIGERQDVGRRRYVLSSPSEFNRASTTIISKKCASLTCSLIFATCECRRTDLTACSSPLFNHPNAYSAVQYVILDGAILLVEPYVSLRTYARIELVYSCASDVSYAIDAITYAEWFRI